jgi:hypothetical protein
MLTDFVAIFVAIKEERKREKRENISLFRLLRLFHVFRVPLFTHTKLCKEGTLIKINRTERLHTSQKGHAHYFKTV